MLAQNVNTDRVKAFDIALRQHQRQVNVVDHHVQHNANIRRSESERTDAMGLDKLGVDIVFLHRDNERIEPFGMPNLEARSSFFG